jgi:hypothetical protein
MNIFHVFLRKLNHNNSNREHDKYKITWKNNELVQVVRNLNSLNKWSWVHS